MLEKTFESLLDCHEIRIVNPKGSQPRIFIGRTDIEAEASVLFTLSSQSIGALASDLPINIQG